MNSDSNKVERDRMIETMDATLSFIKQLQPVAETAIRLVDGINQYEQAKNQLEAIKVKRDIILREFQSIDNLVNNVFNERSKTIALGDKYISIGLKKNDPKSVETGLQIIKLVLMSNPIDTVLDQRHSLKEKIRIVESHIE